MKGFGRGYVLGVVFWALWAALLWGIRPLVLPRHGSWVGDRYWVAGQDCGDVADYTQTPGMGFWGGYSTPPIWVGLGDYEHYPERASAVRAVEWSCK